MPARRRLPFAFTGGLANMRLEPRTFLNADAKVCICSECANPQLLRRIESILTHIASGRGIGAIAP